MGLTLQLTRFRLELRSEVLSLFCAYRSDNVSNISGLYRIFDSINIFICAGMFGAVSAFGYITKTDLSKFRNVFLHGFDRSYHCISSEYIFEEYDDELYNLLCRSNIRRFNSLWYRRSKRMSQSTDADTEQGKKSAVFGSLMLYLDFINMFMFFWDCSGTGSS